MKLPSVKFGSLDVFRSWLGPLRMISGLSGQGRVKAEKEPGGKRLSVAADGKRFVKLVGSANPYSGTEVYPSASGAWTEFPGGPTYTPIYEDWGLAGLAGKVVEIRPEGAEWGFLYKRASAPVPPQCARIVFTVDCVGFVPTVTVGGSPVYVAGPYVVLGEYVYMTGYLPSGTYDWALAATACTEAESGTVVIACPQSDAAVDINIVAKAGYGKGRLVGPLNVPCCCVGPDTLTLTSNDPVIASGAFQNATIAWGAPPAGIVPVVGSSNRYFSTSPLTDTFGDEFYYYLRCLGGGGVGIFQAWPDRSGAGMPGPAGSGAVWRWAVSGSGRCNLYGTGSTYDTYNNSCCPLNLLSGVPYSTIGLTGVCFQLFE